MTFKMMTTSWMQSKVTGANIDFEMRRRRPCYWRGELPPRNYCNPVFSSKVFVGGVPWDITEAALLDVSILIFSVIANVI